MATVMMNCTLYMQSLMKPGHPERSCVMCVLKLYAVCCSR